MNLQMTRTLLSVGGLLLASSSQAALVAQWDMTGQLGTQVTQTGTPGANISNAVISRGTGIAATAANNSFNSTGWTFQTTDYVSLAFTVATGYTVALTNLVVGTQSSGTGPGTLGLYYSGNNFGPSLATLTQGSATLLNSSLSLTSLPTLTAGIWEFRFYEIGTNSAAGGTTASGGTFRLANSATLGAVTFNGTIAPAVSAVPVPASLPLLVAGLGALGFIARRRNSAH
jgi:hypothetical protein